MATPHADRRRAIESALLDFHRTPGRHAPALRQPALLFASIREILLIAAGRGDGGSPASTAVVQAARSFVRAALLRPDADHYALLGLPRTASASAIKQRYRQLMRLTHPDFAQAGANACWPADAATRINRANEVLSSPERRRAYDEESAPPPAAQGTIAKPVPRRAPVPRGVTSRRILPRLAAGFGALGGLALLGLWMSGAPGERDSLVQRATTKIDKFPTLFAAPAPTLTAAAEPAEPVMAAMPMDPPPAARVPEPASALSTLTAQPVALAPVPSPPAAPAPGHPVEQPVAPQAAPGTPAGPTMAAVQQPLTQLLQEIESGWGDNVIAMLDSNARRSAAAQAVARQLDALCDGVRPVKIAKIDFKSEPRDGHLVVNGVITLQVRDAGAPTRQFALQAEFASQGARPVLTRLAPLELTQ
jgi:hypothetical protein